MTLVHKAFTAAPIFLGPANAFFLARSVTLHDRPVGHAVLSAIAMVVCIILTLRLALRSR